MDGRVRFTSYAWPSIDREERENSETSIHLNSWATFSSYRLLPVVAQALVDERFHLSFHSHFVCYPDH